MQTAGPKLPFLRTHALYITKFTLHNLNCHPPVSFNVLQMPWPLNLYNCINITGTAGPKLKDPCLVQHKLHTLHSKLPSNSFTFCLAIAIGTKLHGRNCMETAGPKLLFLRTHALYIAQYVHFTL